MPYKDLQKQKAAQRRWYEKQDKAKLVERTRKERAKRSTVVDEYKLLSGCIYCGYKKCSAALDLHHYKGVKNFSICKGVLACKPIEEIVAELDLCEVVCSNCHREKHEAIHRAKHEAM